MIYNSNRYTLLFISCIFAFYSMFKSLAAVRMIYIGKTINTQEINRLLFSSILIADIFSVKKT